MSKEMKIELPKGEERCKAKTNLEVVGESHVPCSKIPTSLLQKKKNIRSGIFRKVTFVWSMQASIMKLRKDKLYVVTALAISGSKHDSNSALSCQLLQGCKLVIEVCCYPVVSKPSSLSSPSYSPMFIL